MVKNGNLSFWKKANKKADLVYNELLNDEAWVIDNGSIQIDKKNLTGPFFLYVPSLNKTIKFYGKAGKFEESQKRIEQYF
jgi:hypothetical protein